VDLFLIGRRGVSVTLVSAGVFDELVEAGVDLLDVVVFDEPS